MQQGLKIRQARSEMGFTANDLAVMTGIHVNTISRFENDKRTPTFAQLILLAYYLEVSLYYLIDNNHPHKNILDKLERVT